MAVSHEGRNLLNFSSYERYSAWHGCRETSTDFRTTYDPK